MNISDKIIIQHPHGTIRYNYDGSWMPLYKSEAELDKCPSVAEAASALDAHHKKETTAKFVRHQALCVSPWGNRKVEVVTITSLKGDEAFIIHADGRRSKESLQYLRTLPPEPDGFLSELETLRVCLAKAAKRMEDFLGNMTPYSYLHVDKSKPTTNS